MSTARRALAVCALTLAGLAACTAGQVTGTPATSPPPVTSGPQYPSVNPPTPQLYRVDSVYDGDTLRVFEPDGNSVSVRVLGIDAPEMKPKQAPEDISRSDAPDPVPECGAVDARDLARSLLQGNSVQLTEDPEQGDHDGFGRLLRYVTLPDGKDLAGQLLTAGWVQVFEEYPVARTPEYRALQENAKAAESGGWAMCGWEN